MAAVDEGLRDQVRDRYARAALTVTEVGATADCCGGGGCGPTVLDEAGEAFGAALYEPDQTSDLPEDAVLASLGCGNPLAVAQLREGERVLDLGSGGGIDVLLSAKRVGATGFAYGLDMTDEMLALARANAAKAGATNVEFVKGHIEDIPLPDAAVDVVISNCVINLSVDKPAVLAQMFRVLTPGGRIGISDVVAEDQLTAADRAERGSYVGCIAGALSRGEYLDGLAAAGFVDADVTFTHEAAPGMHAAIVRATKPISTDN
jgi:SAM-dependent methyltransferase